MLKMLNEKGFLFVEVVAAFSILLTVMLTLIPIIYQIKLEEHLLHQQSVIELKLHDDLQTYLWTSDYSLPVSYQMYVENNRITYTFTEQQNLVKGCASWVNVKNEQQKFCLYGYPA